MKPGNWGRETGDRREVSLSLKCPVIKSQASLVKQMSENVPSVPEFPEFPTLCVDAFGGHLARRWGALLRHLRLPRLGHQARLFVHLDPLLARNRRDQLANRFERQIVRRLEMNATLPHIELLPRRLERRLQLLELTRTPKRAHH